MNRKNIELLRLNREAISTYIKDHYISHETSFRKFMWNLIDEEGFTLYVEKSMENLGIGLISLNTKMFDIIDEETYRLLIDIWIDAIKRSNHGESDKMLVTFENVKL